MSCQEIENRILDYQENQLSSAQRVEVETHLAACAECRVFARQIQQLDLLLLANFKVPILSASFNRRLHERIQSAPVVLSEAQRAERKRQLHAEFEADLARIRRRSFALGNLLRHLTWPALGVVAGWLAWRITLQLTAHLDTQSLGGLNPNLVPWFAAGTVCLGVGLAKFFPVNWFALMRGL